MHIKLSLVNETKIAKKKPVNQIHWINNSEEHVLQFNTNHEIGEINLSSGNFTKYLFFTWPAPTKIISSTLIPSEKFGNIVLGVYNSGDIIFQHKKFKRVLKGPDGLVTPILQVPIKPKVFSPLASIQGLKKLYFGGTDESSKPDETKEERDVGAKFARPSKPFIFGSKDLSLIILLTSYSEIHVWIRKSLAAEGSEEEFDGEWTTYKIPDEIPTPGCKNKGVSIDVLVICSEPAGVTCIVSLCFCLENILIISSLNLQWNTVYGTKNGCPLVEWKHEEIHLRNRNARTQKPMTKRNSVVSKFASDERILCAVVNSFSSRFELVYFRPDGQFVNLFQCTYPRGSVGRSRWVSCLSWSWGNRYIIGCMRSGHIFIASRFGHLLTIQPDNIPGIGIAGKYVLLFPELRPFQSYRKGNDESEASSLTTDISKPKFSILIHPEKELVVLSSGLHFCCIVLSKDLSSTEELLTFFLKQTHRGNHELEIMSCNHDYDFIHCSNWRLASRSLLDLSLLINSSDQRKEDFLSLWFPGNVETKAATASTSVSFTEFEIQVQATFEHLENSWALMSSSKCFQNKEKLLGKVVVSESLRFFRTILLNSPANDNEEHQMRLIQCLRLFHQLVKEASSVARSFFAIKPLLRMLHMMVHLVLESVRPASVERNLICLLILTQTLTVFRHTLENSSFISIVENNDVMLRLESEAINFGTILDFRMKRVWLFLCRQLFIVFKEERIRKVAKLRRALFAATNIVQEQTQKFHFPNRKIKVSDEFKSIAQGKLKKAVDKITAKLEKLLNLNSPCKRKLKKWISVIFYLHFLESDYLGLARLTIWLFQKLATCSKRANASNLQEVFICFLGNFGVLLTKLVLKIPIYIPSNLSFYEYSSVLDNPKQNCTLVHFMGESSDDLINIPTAIRCLIIGRKYEALFYLAQQLGDARLCLFALLIMKEISRDDVDDVIGNFLFTTLSSQLSKKSDHHSEDETELMTKSFHTSEQLLHFDILVGRGKLLAQSIHLCITEVKELVKELPLIVPEKFPLPAPPLFCSQIENEEDIFVGTAGKVEEIESTNYFMEVNIRSNLSHWIRQFCLLCAASGISGFFVQSTIEEGMEIDFKKKDLNEIFFCLVHGKENVEFGNSNDEWIELKELWKTFLDIVCSLHARERLSLAVRNWVRSKASSSKYSVIQEKCLVVLSEAARLFFSAICEWKRDAFPLIVSSLQESPHTPEVVRLLASVVSHQEQVPSLLKGKYMAILEQWKKVFHSSDGEEYQDSAVKKSLFDFYENELKVGGTRTSFYPLLREDVDCLFMLASTSLYNLQKEFCLREAPYPFLSLFSHQIKALEFNGINPTGYLSSYADTEKSNKTSRLESVFLENNDFGSHKHYMGINARTKRGLLRNRKQTTHCQINASTNTALILYTDQEKIFKKLTRRSFVSGKGEEGKYLPKKTKSFYSNDRNADKSTRKVASIDLCYKKCPSTAKALSNCLAEVYNYCLFRNYNLEAVQENSLCLILWILRRDRIFDELSFPQQKGLNSQKFSTNDIKLAVLWHSSSLSKNKIKNTRKKTKMVCKKEKNDEFSPKRSQQNLPETNIAQVQDNDKSRLELETKELSGQRKEVKPIIGIRENSEIFSDREDTNSKEIKENTTNFNLTQREETSSSRTSSRLSSTENVQTDEYQTSVLEAFNNSHPWQPFVLTNKKAENSEDTSTHSHFTFRSQNDRQLRTNSSGSLRKVEYSSTNSKQEHSLQSESSSSSVSMDNSSMSIDDTLDDITLPDSSHDSHIDVMTNLRSLINTNNNFTRKISKESSGCDNDKLTFLRAKPNHPANNAQKNLVFKSIPYKPNQTKAAHPVPFDLSHILCTSPSRDEEKINDWSLKRIPSNFLKETIPAHSERKNKPLRLLKTPQTFRQPLEEKRLALGEVCKTEVQTNREDATLRFIKVPSEIYNPTNIDKSRRTITNDEHFPHKILQLDLKKPSEELIKRKTLSPPPPPPIVMTDKSTQSCEIKTNKPESRKTKEIGLKLNDENLKTAKVKENDTLRQNKNKSTFQNKYQQTDSPRGKSPVFSSVTAPIGPRGTLITEGSDKMTQETMNENRRKASFSRVVQTENKHVKNQEQQTDPEKTTKAQTTYEPTSKKLNHLKDKIQDNAQTASTDLQRKMKSKDVTVDVRNAILQKNWRESSELVKRVVDIPPEVVKTQLGDYSFEIEEKPEGEEATVARPDIHAEGHSNGFTSVDEVGITTPVYDEGNYVECEVFNGARFGVIDEAGQARHALHTCRESTPSKKVTVQPYNHPLTPFSETLEDNTPLEYSRFGNDIICYEATDRTLSSVENEYKLQEKPHLPAADGYPSQPSGSGVAVHGKGEKSKLFTNSIGQNDEPENFGSFVFEDNLQGLISQEHALHKQAEHEHKSEVSLEPENIQDVLNLFVRGIISVDEVCNRLSVSHLDDIIKLNEQSSKAKKGSEKEFRELVNEVNKAKREISSVKHSLSQVENITNEYSDKSSAFLKRIEHQFETHQPHREVEIAYPETETQSELLKYLHRIAPCNLTQAVVSRILDVAKHELKDENFGLESSIPRDSRLSNFEENTSPWLSLDQDFSDTHKSDLSQTQKEAGSPDSSHRFSTTYRSDSIPSPMTPSSDAREKRKKEIRAWMQRKRRERRENSPKVSNADQTKEKLTGREILQRNRAREQRREQLREEHLRKRKESFDAILAECFADKDEVNRIFRRGIKMPHNDLNNEKKRVQKLDSHCKKSQPSFLRRKLPSKSRQGKTSRVPSNSAYERSAKQFKIERQKDVVLYPKVFSRRSSTDIESQPKTTLVKTAATMRRPPKAFNSTKSFISCEGRVARSLDCIPEVDTPVNESNFSSLSTESTWSLPEEMKQLLN